MLYKRPDSPFYWTRFTVGGRRVRCSTETAVKHEAAAFEARLRQREWARSHAGAHTWDEAVTRWLDERAHKRSLDRDKSVLEWTREGRLRGVLLADISRDVLDGLRKEKATETTPATANRYMAVIRAILNVARDQWEWLDRVPKVPLYGQTVTDYQWLTRQEFASLLVRLPEHTRQLARFAVATGLRRTNVTHLRWSQVDMDREHVHVNASESKSGKGLRVPLNDDALTVLEEQAGKHEVWVFPYHGEPVYQVSTKAWRDAVKGIGRVGFRFHDLRHTWASWHVQGGTPLHALQALGGWSSPVLVSRYGHHDSLSLSDYAKASGTNLARRKKRKPRKAA